MEQGEKRYALCACLAVTPSVRCLGRRAVLTARPTSLVGHHHPAMAFLLPSFRSSRKHLLPGGLHSRHGILRTLMLPFQCPPGLQPKHHLKQFDESMANKIFTRLWTTSWRKWKERQISKLHIWQTLFVIRMLEAPFDFIGTSEIKVRP